MAQVLSKVTESLKLVFLRLILHGNDKLPFGVFPQENFEAILEMIELIQIPDNNDFSKKQDISQCIKKWSRI